MRPQGVVLPAPAISQGLGLGHGGEQLGDQELIPEGAVERLGKAVLPRWTWLDVGRCGGAAFSPAPEGVGDELGTVVRANERRRRVEAGQLLEHGHDVLGLTPPAPRDR